MELDHSFIEQFNGKFIDEVSISFLDNIGNSIQYNSELNLWSESDFFKVINPKKLSVPKKVNILSNLPEGLFLYNLWNGDINKNKFDEEIIIISNQNSVSDLLQYIYDYIIIFNKDLLNINFFHRQCSYSGIVNIININNFFTTNKITYNISEEKLCFSNDYFLDMPVNLSSLDRVLMPFIKYRAHNKILKEQYYKYLLNW